MKILFLGDSLVEYFDWQARFPEHAVENRGVAGETAAGLLGRIDRTAARFDEPDAVLVMTGTNDLLLGAEHVAGTVAEIAARLRRHYPRARILLHSVLPVHARWAAPEAVAALNAGISAVAVAESVSYLDLAAHFAESGGAPRPGLLLEDGVHLSEEGYRLWAKVLEQWLVESTSDAV